MILSLSLGTFALASEKEGEDFNPSTVYTKFDYDIVKIS